MSNSWVGKTLGKVQIEAPLARGGVAEVYLGTHTTLQRKVAVKILRNPSEEHSDALERFQREARTVAKLRHPNIVQVYDFDMVDNDPYLVMEYIQGPSLSKYLYFLHQNNKRLELPQIVRLISGVANALQYAHNNGIIHRDIKPGNILLISPTSDIEAGEPLPDDFEPVLTDFGLIRFLDSARQTTTGVTAGTPAYMSPEQAQGETTDGRTDVYSLGIVLYELLAGKLPFDGETTMSILLKHVSQAPEPILDIPPSIHKILDRALAKDVKDRFQTPMEFANAFSASVDINPGTMQMEGLASLGPSTIEFQNAPTRIADKKWVKPLGSKWVRLAVAGFTALLVGAFLFFNGLPLSASPEPTSTSPAPTFTFISTGTGTATSTVTPTSVPIILGPSIILHFRDGNAIADQAVLEAERIPAPPADNKYEVWLMSSRKRISLGILTLDEEGMGTLTFTDEQGINLAATYDQAEITIEPENDTRLSSSGWVAYTYTLPEDGLANVRYLLSAYPSAPN
ncbi:MAG TPA: protein kinase, partial [Anaerolineales bacterium]